MEKTKRTGLRQVNMQINKLSYTKAMEGNSKGNAHAHKDRTMPKHRAEKCNPAKSEMHALSNEAMDDTRNGRPKERRQQSPLDTMADVACKLGSSVGLERHDNPRRSGRGDKLPRSAYEDVVLLGASGCSSAGTDKRQDEGGTPTNTASSVCGCERTNGHTRTRDDIQVDCVMTLLKQVLREVREIREDVALLRRTASHTCVAGASDGGPTGHNDAIISEGAGDVARVQMLQTVGDGVQRGVQEVQEVQEVQKVQVVRAQGPVCERQECVRDGEGGQSCSEDGAVAEGKRKACDLEAEGRESSSRTSTGIRDAKRRKTTRSTRTTRSARTTRLARPRRDRERVGNKRRRDNWTEEENRVFTQLVIGNVGMEEMCLRRLLAARFRPRRTHEQCANHLRILRAQGKLPLSAGSGTGTETGTGFGVAANGGVDVKVGGAGADAADWA